MRTVQLYLCALLYKFVVHMQIKIKLLLSILFWAVATTSFSQINVFSDHLSMDSLINSPHDEGDIVLSPDGQWMLFSRSGDPTNSGDTDIWISQMQSNGTWGKPTVATNVNQKGVNQPLGFVGKDRVLVFVNGELKTYMFENGRLMVPRDFMVMYFKFLSRHMSGCVSADGNILLFGMESYGSYGVEDIYMSKKREDGTWTTPKNLSQTINTDFQEISPFLAPDNKTLIFASNGHGGAGSFDLFMSTRQDDTWQNWSKPVSLGSSVNTSGRESAFTFRLGDEYGYLVTTQNSEGYGDIKRVKIMPNIEPAAASQVATLIETETVASQSRSPQEKLFSVKGKVYDKESGRTLVGAEIIITSTDRKNTYKVNSNSEGVFYARIAERKDYNIKISKFRYISYELFVMASDLNRLDGSAFSLDPIKEGKTVSLENVLFEQGTPVLLEESYQELDLLVEMMMLNPDINIFLAGHTDNQGNFSANVKLSEDRVGAVTDYLTSRGIDRKRISGRGYGGTKPRASNANPETRKLNRRVEFTIHENKE